MAPKKGGGSKLTRSETVTVRLDPKLLYLAEIAARKQRRTLSSYIEWAVAHSFSSVELEENGYNGEAICLSHQAATLWDSDEAERFVKLAINYPDLLTFEEQRRWKVLRDSAFLLPAKSRDHHGNLSYDHGKLEDQVFPVLRRHWNAFVEAVDTGQERAWIEANLDLHERQELFDPYDKLQKKSGGAPQNFDLDDEIPF